MRRSPRLASAVRVALLYLGFGVLWILLSDLALAALADSTSAYQQWQTYKGSVFVLVSGLVIFLLVRREQRLRRHGERLFSEVLDLVPHPVAVTRVGDDAYVDANRAFARLLDRTPDEVIGSTPGELGLRFEPSEWEEYRRLLKRDGRVGSFPLHLHLPAGDERTLLLSSRRRTYDGQDLVFAAAHDVTELQEARDRFESQVRRIQALRDIDMAITSSLDVRVTLNVVLDQVVSQLDVDAAAVLLLNEGTRTLELSAGRGFRGGTPLGARLDLGDGHPGRAAAERTLVRVADLREAPDGLARPELVEEEGFVYYVATPLLAKGHVSGVLEIFHRSRREPTQDWFDYLDTLAGQASIAIDNAELYQDLQRSNQELRAAYDETIEGWARALDLRDRETHGHTRRVARVSVELARRIGVPDERLEHVRWGALLHDIGKMGIPDAVLRKPGPLDDEEWELMERHPEIAFRLLSPVEFLRPALDIPRYHHEKWDGTGYPHGLEGREIPLTARIFAVVDVWDALLSHRPYREAWSEDDTFAYLREEAGSHFDPQVMEAFLGLDLASIPIPERTEPEGPPGAQTDLFRAESDEEG